jgi:hypothetical protein
MAVQTQNQPNSQYVTSRYMNQNHMNSTVRKDVWQKPNPVVARKIQLIRTTSEQSSKIKTSAPLRHTQSAREVRAQVNQDECIARQFHIEYNAKQHSKSQQSLHDRKTAEKLDRHINRTSTLSTTEKIIADQYRVLAAHNQAKKEKPHTNSLVRSKSNQELGDRKVAEQLDRDINRNSASKRSTTKQIITGQHRILEESKKPKTENHTKVSTVSTHRKNVDTLTNENYADWCFRNISGDTGSTKHDKQLNTKLTKEHKKPLNLKLSFMNTVNNVKNRLLSSFAAFKNR